MSHPESSLPESWVERIWLAMRATYGAAFDRQWQCPAGADPVDHVRGLKAHWGRELARLQQNPAAIRHGLENMPAHPPNLIEFKALCVRRPDYVQAVALPAPEANPERVAAALSVVQKASGMDMLDWAHRLKAREAHQKAHGCDSRDRLTPYQREAWRIALKADSAVEVEAA